MIDFISKYSAIRPALLGPVLFVVAGCPQLPSLTALPAARQKAAEQSCAALFPSGCWEVVHTIDVEVALTGHRSSVLGVSSGDSGRRSVSSVLMTPEGMVLFEGKRRGDRVEVSRALPPLDKHAFGRRLFDDVLLALFPPQGAPTGVGRDADGRAVCRWQQPGRTVDLSPSRRGPSLVTEYDEGDAARRTVRHHGPTRAGFASLLELSASGAAGYTMALSLVRAEAVQCD